MERRALHELRRWRGKTHRKPLLVRGARQVGKTWIIKEFGRLDFRKFHYLAFDRRPEAGALFSQGLGVSELLKGLALLFGVDIEPAHDLLILDEIQESPAALSALKQLAEELPQLPVCCAGSHVGLALSESSFPVGKVEMLDMYPMTFEEFLLATNARAAEVLSSFSEETTIPDVVHQILWAETRNYLVTGGMPEAVQRYVELRDRPAEAFRGVREVHRTLVEGYRSDFAKHAGKQNAHHISLIFGNIPQQMSSVVDGSVQRYRFKGVVPGRSKFAQFEGPIEWLVEAGLAYKVFPVTSATIPLSAFSKNNLFKLYLFDVGLLSSMLEIPPQSIVMQDYGSYKGFVAECLVAQELRAAGETSLFSWHGRTSEIEFLVVRDGQVVPVEVKSGARARSHSLVAFCSKYSPSMKIKVTARNLDRRSGAYHNYPLYLAGKL